MTNDFRNTFMYKEFEKYTENLDKIRDIINNDLGPVSPEKGFVESELFSNAAHSQGEKCNVITRYFEDENYARAYCLESYSFGIMIIFDKINISYNIIVLDEDDGWWFPTNYYDGCYTLKINFIYALTEAISLFNSNFKSI